MTSMDKIEDEKIAYIAGLIDASGRISTANVNGYRKAYGIQIEIESNSSEALEWLKTTLNAGTVSYYDNQSHHNCGVYTISGKSADDLLNLIEPYVIIKKKLVGFILIVKRDGRLGIN